MFFCKNENCFKWELRGGEQHLKGKITLRISTIKNYDDLWFKIPSNNPASFDYVPLAIQIKGTIEECEGIPCEKTTAYFLIPEPDFERANLNLRSQGKIRMWINDKKKCFKVEKVA